MDTICTEENGKNSIDRCLKICSANLDNTISDRLLDQFDEAIFKLCITSAVDDTEVLAADVADVLVDLADIIERYGKNII